MSKLIMHDFLCDTCTHRFEDLVNPDDPVAECPECGGTGSRQVSPANLDWLSMGKDPDFPTFADKWTKAHERP